MLSMIGRRQFSGALTLLTAEQIQLKEAAAQYAQENIKPWAQKISNEDAESVAALRKFMTDLGELGMNGVTVPEEYGGSDLGYLEHCLITEEIARASGAVNATYTVSTNLCIDQLRKHGNEEQKQKYLPKLCSGEHIGALAMSEPGSGSDVMSMKLKAEKVDGGYVLNGTKFWISNGPIADTIVVYARSNPDERNKGVTAFIIERGFKGFANGQKLDKFGIRGSPTGELVFDNCFVPEENILGKVGGGAYVLMSGLNTERLIIAAAGVGGMQTVMDEVGPYAAQRKQFGAAIGTFQLIQEKLAFIYTSLEASRAMVYTNAIQADKKQGTNAEFAATCLFVTDLGTKVALDGMQIFGGNGYINDYPLGRLVCDAKAGEILGGTQEIRKLIIGRELMEKHS